MALVCRGVRSQSWSSMHERYILNTEVHSAELDLDAMNTWESTGSQEALAFFSM